MKKVIGFLFLSVLMLSLVAADEIILQPGSEGKDTYIRVDDPTKCFGSSKNVDSGQFWVNSAHRALLEFDLSVIPAGANIISAELKLYMYNDGPGKDVRLDVHRMTSSWEEGTTGYKDNGATWNTKDGGLPWIIAGGDFDPIVEDYTVVNLQNQYYSWDVSNLVRNWVEGTFTNYGLILKGNDESSDIQKRKRFRSSDYSNSAQRPQLIVNYNLGPCVPNTCIDLGKQCGVWQDGCGDVIDCGSCLPGEDCYEGMCVAPPEPTNSTWHIQYNPTPLDPAADVGYWNLDLFDVPSETMAGLRSQGVFVMCYFSAGSWEDWRPDEGEFPESCKGANNGWPGEKWIDTNCPEVRQIMRDRIDLGVEKGCDGFDPDNMDAYGNGGGGFGLTQADAIDYYNFLADYAHSKGKKIGLKNALEVIDEVLPNMDYAVNEQCFQYNECDVLSQVVDDGKIVFHIEYGGQSKADSVCPQANALGFSSLIKNMNLDEFEIACWNYETPPEPPPSENIAEDGFESNSWSGGSGWLSEWWHEGDSKILKNNGPVEGSRHLRLRRSSGYVDRQVDLSGVSSATLGFYAKVKSFENSDFAEVLVSSDGSTWNVLRTFTPADSDNEYHYYEFDLTSYGLTNSVTIAFDAEMSGRGDHLYVDDIRIF